MSGSCLEKSIVDVSASKGEKRWKTYSPPSAMYTAHALLRLLHDFSLLDGGQLDGAHEWLELIFVRRFSIQANVN